MGRKNIEFSINRPAGKEVLFIKTFYFCAKFLSFWIFLALSLLSWRVNHSPKISRIGRKEVFDVWTLFLYNCNTGAYFLIMLNWLNFNLLNLQFLWTGKTENKEDAAEQSSTATPTADAKNASSTQEIPMEQWKQKSFYCSVKHLLPAKGDH